MIYTCKPKRLEIYVNSAKKSMDQIKEETGCDVIINGGLFNPDWTPCCHLKAGGDVYGADQYSYFGYGWNEAADIRLTSEYGGLLNYICCVCLLRGGKAEPLSYPSEMGGARPRTAIGLYPDGRVWFYASGEGKTPEALQAICASLGLDSALMLDGGGSTQGISPAGAYRQTRRVHNFILAWLNEICHYTEPTEDLGRQDESKVKWLQWHLNRAGAKLNVDGLFGPLTHAAAVEFMSRYPNLTADGIVGPLTRKYLKAYEPPEPEAPVEIIKPAYVWRGEPSKRSMTNYIILHHAAVTAATPESIHAYHKSLGWCGIGYNFYVRKDGKVYEGRPIDCIGAHTVNYNNKSVGICFEGNFEIEQMGAAQLEAGKKLVKYVRSFYPSAVLKKHKDLDATACPGKNFPFDEFK